MNSEISLFIPCLVDQVLPEIGLATARILEKLGFTVTYDSRQTCCGQPAFNAGHWDESRKVARQFLNVFENAECVVSPSGSCIAMVRNFYPKLFPELNEKQSLGKRAFELSEFLVQHADLQKLAAKSNAAVSLHNSCHAMREAGITTQFAEVLQQVAGLKLIELDKEHTCCGFGGLFSFKNQPIAATMAKTRLNAFAELEIDALLVNDPGCIMHMRQQAKRQQFKPEILHFVEFLDRVTG